MSTDGHNYLNDLICQEWDTLDMTKDPSGRGTKDLASGRVRRYNRDVPEIEVHRPEKEVTHAGPQADKSDSRSLFGQNYTERCITMQSVLSQTIEAFQAQVRVLEEAAQTTDLDRLQTLRTMVEEALNAGKGEESNDILRNALNTTQPIDTAQCARLAAKVEAGINFYADDAEGDEGLTSDIDAGTDLLARYGAALPKRSAGGARGPRDPNAPRVSNLDFLGARATVRANKDNKVLVTRNPDMVADKGVKWNDLRFYTMQAVKGQNATSIAKGMSETERSEWSDAEKVFKAAPMGGTYTHRLNVFGVTITLEKPQIASNGSETESAPNQEEGEKTDAAA